MSELFQAGFHYLVGLVCPHHRRKVRLLAETSRMRQESPPSNDRPKITSDDRSSITSSSRSKIFGLDVDSFKNVADHLSPADLLRLSMTCKEYRDSNIVQEATYREPFRRNDLPKSNYRGFVKLHKPFFDSLLRGINESTGRYVKRMAMYEWATIKTLQRLAQLCPNLTHIDFTGIVEPIDATRYKRYHRFCTHGFHGRAMHDIPENEVNEHEDATFEWNEDQGTIDVGKAIAIQIVLARCHACSDRFQWPLVLKYCPGLFENLTTMRLSYAGARRTEYSGSISSRRHLPMLLKLATRLQTLEFSGSKRFASRENRAEEQECLRFRTAIVKNASDELRILGLYDMNALIPNLSDFLLPFEEKLTKLKTVKLTFHADLNTHKCDPSAIPGGTTKPLEYISAARHAIERRWKLIATDAGDEYPTHPWPYFSLTDPANVDQLRWLLQSDIVWTPVFKWKDYAYRNSRHAFGARESKIDADYLPIRALFSELKHANLPIRLLLKPPGYEDGFFSWQTNTLPDTRETPRFVGSSPWGKEALPWRLDTIGDLVDDLRLIWRCGHVFGREMSWEIPQAATPKEAATTVSEHLARTRHRLEERLEFESQHIAPFFKKLHHFCPNLTRLAQHIPAPLYPSQDATFISAILPGDDARWTVKQYGSGAVDKNLSYLDTPIDEGDGYNAGYDTDDDLEEEMDWEIKARKMLTSDQVEKMLRTAEEERLPMIERVFTRSLNANGTAVPAKLLGEGLYETPRGEGLRCFDITSLVGKLCFEELWGEPVSKSDLRGRAEWAEEAPFSGEVDVSWL